MHSQASGGAFRFALYALIALTAAAAFPPAARAQTQAPAAWTDTEARTTALDAAAQIESTYTDPAIARRIASAIRAGVRRGQFDGAPDGRAFAERLQAAMHAVYDDKHFTVMFRPQGAPPSSPPLEELFSQPADPDAAAWGRFVNGGAARAERLAGNIGYLAVEGMPEPIGGGGRALAAIAFVQETDALIVDLRQCNGGDPAMAGFYQSALTDGAALEYGRFEWRSGAAPHILRTPALERARIYDPAKPIFLLVGPDTVSACEELVYMLNQRGRVTLVGAPTAGGANPGRLVRAGERFSIFLPSGRFVAANGGGNWEGPGIAPHVEVAVDAALERAHRIALEQVSANPARAPFERFIASELREAGLAAAP